MTTKSDESEIVFVKDLMLGHFPPKFARKKAAKLVKILREYNPNDPDSPDHYEQARRTAEALKNEVPGMMTSMDAVKLIKAYKSEFNKPKSLDDVMALVAPLVTAPDEVKQSGSLYSDCIDIVYQYKGKEQWMEKVITLTIDEHPITKWKLSVVGSTTVGTRNLVPTLEAYARARDFVRAINEMGFLS